MKKDPILACVLSLLLAGSGHLYLGHISKGVIIMVVGIALAIFTHFILYLPFVAWAMYSAHSTAQAMND